MEILVNNKLTIDFIDGENIFSVDFLSVSKEKSVTKNSEAANLKLLKDTDAILSINENTVNIDFYKKVKYLQFVTFSLITDLLKISASNK